MAFCELSGTANMTAEDTQDWGSLAPPVTIEQRSRGTFPPLSISCFFCGSRNCILNRGSVFLVLSFFRLLQGFGLAGLLSYLDTTATYACCDGIFLSLFSSSSSRFLFSLFRLIAWCA